MKKIMMLCMLVMCSQVTYAGGAMSGDAMRFRADSSNLYFMFKDYGAEHGSYPASFSAFSASTSNNAVFKKFTVIRWDVGEGRDYRIQLQSVENEAFQVTIDSASYMGPTFNDAVRAGPSISQPPATTGADIVSFAPEDFKAAEAAAKVFWESLKNKDIAALRMSFCKDVMDSQTTKFRDEVNDERLSQLESMLGIFSKVLKSTPESRTGREGWIKVYGEFKKVDGSTREGRAYFKKEDGIFKVIKL